MGKITLQNNGTPYYLDYAGRPNAESVKTRHPEEWRSKSPEWRKANDAGFAFLTNNLAKVDPKIYKPLSDVTYLEDLAGCISVTNELVDSFEFYSADYAGIADTVNNMFGSQANVVPVVGGGVSQTKLAVFTFEIAYEFKFVELEKLAGKKVPASIESVYQDLVRTGWDLFVNRVAYLGGGAEGGLLNNSKVYVGTFPGVISSTIGTVTDAVMLAGFNTIIKAHLDATNYNRNAIPDTIIVPTTLAASLVNRVNSLYSEYLLGFISKKNLATATAAARGIKDHELNIVGRPQANELGVAGVGRIVLYKKDPSFVKLNITYDFKPFHTGPDMSKMSYVTLFVGQVAELQLPYNDDDTVIGGVSYWDFAS